MKDKVLAKVKEIGNCYIEIAKQNARIKVLKTELSYLEKEELKASLDNVQKDISGMLGSLGLNQNGENKKRTSKRTSK